MVSDFVKKQKRSPKKQMMLMLGAVLVLFILVLLLVANIRIYQKKQKYLSQVESLRNKIEELQEQKIKLEEGISRSDDEKYLEKVAREELDLQKPGESVVSFIVEENKEVPKQPDKDVLRSLWVWLGSIFSF